VQLVVVDLWLMVVEHQPLQAWFNRLFSPTAPRVMIMYVALTLNIFVARWTSLFLVAVPYLTRNLRVFPLDKTLVRGSKKQSLRVINFGETKPR